MSADDAAKLQTDEQAQESLVMHDEQKRDKFLRLLGGKKPQNKEATAEWLKKSRTDEDEQSLAKGLENQYTTNMSQVVAGKTKRHEGIGFNLTNTETKCSEVPSVSPPHSDNDNEVERSRTSEKQNSTVENRHRSRSPLDRSKNESQENKSKSSHEQPPSVTNKKSFYMQFKKSSE